MTEGEDKVVRTTIWCRLLIIAVLSCSGSTAQVYVHRYHSSNYLGEDTLGIGETLDGREKAGLGKDGEIDGKVANASSNARSNLIAHCFKQEK